eukprot:Clim_evm6s230 gene=Clim_evmTU6s230
MGKPAVESADVVVVGGGLAGLQSANLLLEKGRSVVILESRDRLGGRIHSLSHGSSNCIELGPAWVFPGHRRMEALVKEAGGELFPQYASGRMQFVAPDGMVQHRPGGAMGGANRASNGLSSVIRLLEQRIRAYDGDCDSGQTGEIRLGTNVTKIERIEESKTVTGGDHARVLIEGSNGLAITARAVVLTGPPRLYAQTVEFLPPLPAEVKNVMLETSTWMGQAAKVILYYDCGPFWRHASPPLTGDITFFADDEPVAQFHDHSPPSVRSTDTAEGVRDFDAAGNPVPGVLFGWLNENPAFRVDPVSSDDTSFARIRDGAVRQAVMALGEQAAHPSLVKVHDWYNDPHTTHPDDALEPVMAHPRYGPAALSDPARLGEEWEGVLHLAGTEISPDDGGFMEGALISAERVAKRFRS